MHVGPRRLFALPLLFSAFAAGARDPIPIEDLAKLPDIQSVSMSADGRNLAAIVAAPGSNHRETAFATWNLEDPEAKVVLTPSGNQMKFIGAAALKADRILVLARQEWTGHLAGCGEGSRAGATRTFVSKAYLTDTAHSGFDEAFAANARRLGVSKEMQRCLEIAGTASLVNTLPLDPENVIVSQLNALTLGGSYHLYNLRTNETKLLFLASSSSSPALFDPRDGKVLARSELEPVGGNEYMQKILLLDPEDGRFDEHGKLSQRLSQRHVVELVGRDEKSGKYYVLTDLFSDRVEARMYDPVARAFDDEPLLSHPRFAIGGLVFGTQPSDFNQVLGYTVDGMVRETTYIEPRMQAIQAGLQKAHPGQDVAISAYNDDRSRVLFTTSGPGHPPAYHLLLDGKWVRTIGSQRPWIDSADIGEQRWVEYTARDGRKIPAILDLPVGWSKADGPLPAIVHPHGGPWARDFGGWDPSGWVPFLTSRGYAVLRPQYRGSAGLGRDLWLAGDAQWGLAMQDDKDDGAAWLVEQGIAASDRIAIFGYSYGGFAAAAAAVRPDGPYQCAIAGAPVTDLARLGIGWSENRIQRVLQGRTIKGMDPMRNAQQASIPILLFVGDRDVRTPEFHAREFHAAVARHVPARFESIPDMPHSMPWYVRHQETTLALVEGYLAEECGEGGL